MTDIYNEDSTTSNQIIPVIIELDFNKLKTLHELISPVKEATKKSTSVILYIVCGNEINQNDYTQFFAYLTSIYGDYFNERIDIRGNIHYDFISILTAYKCRVAKGSKLIHDRNKLYFVLDTLKGTPLLQTFIKRYNDSYYQFPLAHLDLQELSIIGFQYETF